MRLGVAERGVAEREVLEWGDWLRVDGDETDECDNLNGTKSFHGTKVFLNVGEVAVADQADGGEGALGNLNLTGMSVSANNGSLDDAQVVASEDSIVDKEE